MTRLDSSADAVAIIELLKGVLARDKACAKKRGPPPSGDRVDAYFAVCHKVRDAWGWTNNQLLAYLLTRKYTSGRTMRNVYTAAEAEEAIDFLQDALTQPPPPAPRETRDKSQQSSTDPDQRLTAKTSRRPEPGWYGRLARTVKPTA